MSKPVINGVHVLGKTMPEVKTGPILKSVRAHSAKSPGMRLSLTLVATIDGEQQVLLIDLDDKQTMQVACAIDAAYAERR